MIILLLALCPPGQTHLDGVCKPVPPELVRRCLDAEHAPSCDEAVARMGRSTPLGFLRRACAFEAPQACWRLAKSRARHGLPSDPAEAEQVMGWLAVACLSRPYSEPKACVRLAASVDAAQLSRAARREALTVAERACRSHPEVCYRLGMDGVGRGHPKARRWLERACRGGDPRACGELAWRLEQGEELAKAPKAAARFGDRACQLGDRLLCQHRLRARRAARDRAGIRRACRRGDALSCAHLDARRCRRGDAAACSRAATPLPNACPLQPGVCRGVPPLPPGRRECPPVDACEPQRRGVARALAAPMRAAIPKCASTSLRLQIEVATSGDVFRVTGASPEVAACLLDQLDAASVPAAPAPVPLRVMAVFKDGQWRVHLRPR